MLNHLRQEMGHMNKSGSPFICIICQGRLFNTPRELQLHLVSTHGAESGPSRCALCNVDIKPKRQADDDRRLLRVAYERHVFEEHLPEMELFARLLYAGPYFLPRTLVQAAPLDDSIQRAFRCIFEHRMTAGQGSRYPFYHWLMAMERDDMPKRGNGLRDCHISSTPGGSSPHQFLEDAHTHTYVYMYVYRYRYVDIEGYSRSQNNEVLLCIVAIS
ncbi:unnamed protein product [Protopolystoma xenopodis]|uniref:C2H2-type domain-containing protein n=1 Tax=Protopolystoma xenopodis TaxID=117903 RepID=A0A3S5CK08_9PLAT|nr:unnamed protein product [Protopolystoma xenopodis]